MNNKTCRFTLLLHTLQQRLPVRFTAPDKPQNYPFPLEDLDPNQIHGSLDPRESAPKRYLDRFSRFCTAHPCAQDTDTNTDHVTCDIRSNSPAFMQRMLCGLELQYDGIDVSLRDCSLDVVSNESWRMWLGRHEVPYWSLYSKPRMLLYSVTVSKYFDLAIAGVIGLNVITMALEFYLMPKVSVSVIR